MKDFAHDDIEPSGIHVKRSVGSARHQKPQVGLSRVEPRPELAKIVLILADDLRGVLSIRVEQTEIERIFEEFSSGGKRRPDVRRPRGR